MADRVCSHCSGDGLSRFRTGGKCIYCDGSGTEGVCDRMIRERKESDRQRAVAEPGEHFLDRPHCPHCGETVEEWWELESLRNDDDTAEVECGSCEKPYVITLRVSYEFKTGLVGVES